MIKVYIEQVAGQYEGTTDSAPGLALQLGTRRPSIATVKKALRQDAGIRPALGEELNLQFVAR